MSSGERTFIMIRPEVVERRLVGEIIKRFELKGLRLLAIKAIIPSKSLMEAHYKEHAGKNFYERLVRDMTVGRVVSMVWEGANAVKICRKMLGSTDPLDAEPGTIRADFGLTLEQNSCHGSDCEESAAREISLWFCEDELCI